MTLPPLALSIRQPWAWAILHAGKDVENRTWSTQFRGPVCIHAARKMTREDEGEFARLFYSIYSGGPDSPLLPHHPSSLPRGAIVGTAEILDCRPALRVASPWASGPWCLTLANPRPIEPIPCRGALGFFRWQEGA